MHVVLRVAELVRVLTPPEVSRLRLRTITADSRPQLVDGDVVDDQPRTREQHSQRHAQPIKRQHEKPHVRAEVRGGGLSRYKDGQFITYTEKNGLNESEISSLLEDDDGNPVPPTGEGFMSTPDRIFLNGIINRWVELIKGVPDPLGSQSPGGNTSEAEPTPVATQ